MPTQAERLERAQILLKRIKSEAITIPEFIDDEATKAAAKLQLKLFRGTTLHHAAKYPAPGMTSAIATSLLGVAACNELAQRFVAEYVRFSDDQNISLVFLTSEDVTRKGANHVCVLIGTPKKSEGLITGKGNSLACLADKERFIAINDYFAAQSEDAVLVDPLLNACWSITDEPTELLAYCKSHEITHVTGVRHYQNTTGFAAYANQLFANSNELAKQCRTEYQKSLPTLPASMTVKLAAAHTGFAKLLLCAGAVCEQAKHESKWISQRPKKGKFSGCDMRLFKTADRAQAERLTKNLAEEGFTATIKTGKSGETNYVCVNLGKPG